MRKVCYTVRGFIRQNREAMKYELVIFDLDGTVLDTLPDLASSVNAVLQQHGYPTHSADIVRGFLGSGMRRLVENALPQDVGGEETEFVYRDFCAVYAAHCIDRTKPFAGIVTLLGALRAGGVRTALVSNKADALAQKLCKHFFDGLFDRVRGAMPDVAMKPAPDAVNETLKELSLPREKALYVGDSEIDFQTAQNARMDAFLAAWGYCDRMVLHRLAAARVLSSPEELARAVL